MRALIESVAHSLLKDLGAGVLERERIQHRHQSVHLALEALIPDGYAWAETTPNDDAGQRVVAVLGKEMLYLVTAPEGVKTEVRPIPLDEVLVSSCVERHDADARARTWTLSVDAQPIVIETRQQNETDHVPASEHFVRTLARIKGWLVSDSVPPDPGMVQSD